MTTYPQIPTAPHRIADPILAAFLFARGFSVHESPPSERNCPFEIDYHDALEAEVALFNKGLASVEPVAFHRAITECVKIRKNQQFDAKAFRFARNAARGAK